MRIAETERSYHENYAADGLSVDMTKLKLTYNYHDALIRAVEVKDEQDIVLEIDLCGCCCGIHGGGTVHLFFCGVRNIDEVRAAFESMGHVGPVRDYLDKIIGFDRDEDRRYVLYLSINGNVQIDAKSIIET